MRVRVYRNLNNKLLSIMEISSRLVLGHCQAIRLQNVEFKVNEAGRQRVIKTCRKNVHAFAEGKVLEVTGFEAFKGRRVEIIPPSSVEHTTTDSVVRYNPYKTSHFTNDQGEAVTQADQCLVSCIAPFTTISLRLG